jgi:hypothetical protein
VFEEFDSDSMKKKQASNLRKVIVIRAYLLILALAVFVFMAYLLLKGSLKPITAAFLVLVVAVLMLTDNRLYATKERSHRPIKIGPSGIWMPATWFEKWLLKRGLVPWDDARAVFTVRHNIVENGQIVRGVENELAVIEKKGMTYRSGEKDKLSIEKAVSVISQLWPPYLKLKTSIDRLRQENPRFSDMFAPLDSTSLVFGIAIIDALLIALLGIAITVEASIQLLLVFAVYLVLLDLVFGFLLVKVNESKNLLVTDWSPHP